MSVGLHANWLLFSLILTEIGMILQDLIKMSNMKFKENSLDERVFSHADRHEEFSDLFLQLLFRLS